MICGEPTLTSHEVKLALERAGFAPGTAEFSAALGENFVQVDDNTFIESGTYDLPPKGQTGGG